MREHLRVIIPDTAVHALSSSHVDQEYHISVAIPFSYYEEPKRLFPTIYVLDANWYMGMVTEMTRAMSLQSLPEVIIVGIGYPVETQFRQSFFDVLRLRARDYTPVHDKEVAARMQELVGQELDFGGAGRFLKFIRHELLPLIEGQYRANPTQRTIVGHSWGGLFALYALFHEPKLFSNYIAGSPSLHFGDRIMHQYEHEYSNKRKRLPATLYLGAGALEYDIDVSLAVEMFKFRAILDDRNYKSLKVMMKLFDDCNHTEVIAPLFQAGLKAVLC